MTTARELAAALGGKKKGSAWFCRCPAHDDHSPSLEITEKAGRVLFTCRAGCDQAAVLAALRQRGLWGEAHAGTERADRIVATYSYRDETGALRYQVVRLTPTAKEPKRFRQRRPNGAPDAFIWNVTGVMPLPYGLPALLADPEATVFIAEGEKDCDNLGERGLVATTNHGGAGKWRDEISRWLAGRDVVILPDNDKPGRDHAAEVARKLTGVAGSIRVLELPHLPPKGDVSDWLAAGGTADALEGLVRAAPLASAEAEPAPALPPEFSEDALALRFSAKHGGDARYVDDWGKWLLWTGSHWQLDNSMKAFDLARQICRAASAEITDPKAIRLAASVASAKTVAATIGLARADRQHAATIDQWNADPTTLGGQKMSIELRSGAIRPARRTDYATKRTAVDPGGDCPRWHKFLGEITACDAELQAYLQRVAGYCLTGITSEHVLFFLYGTGANGKSVFTNTLVGIWGDYAVVAAMETFLASQRDHHPTDVAGLHGARLVVAQETERGRRWDESRIKTLTGGDRIRTRFMRQDYFEFTPGFKLLIAGNHKPGLRGVDEAIRRRLHLIPFTVTIPEAHRDHRLFETLKTEWPGILAWAIAGCLEWQRIGLNPPAAVRQATEAYITAEDAFATWLDECCERSASAQTETRELYASWMAWCDRTGEHSGTRKEFSQTIEDRGYRRRRIGHENKHGFQGLAVRHEEAPEPYWNR